MSAIRGVVLWCACAPALAGWSQSASGTKAAQQKAMEPAYAGHPEWPAARPADVATPVATVKAFFATISAPAGETLDRTRLRSLFVPYGRIAVGLAGRGTRPADVLFETPDEYAEGSDDATAKSGFFDRNPANHVQQFGVMAHVYASYESREKPGDAKPMARGIKSFELCTGVMGGTSWRCTGIGSGRAILCRRPTCMTRRSSGRLV